MQKNSDVFLQIMLHSRPMYFCSFQFCKGQSGVECVRKFIPSFRTPLHAVKDIASSIMQCDFEMNEFLPLQFERSLSRIHKFHQVLYGLSIMVSKLNVSECFSTILRYCYCAAVTYYKGNVALHATMYHSVRLHASER